MIVFTEVDCSETLLMFYTQAEYEVCVMLPWGCPSRPVPATLLRESLSNCTTKVCARVFDGK
jgi:hypothetical protein